MALPVMSNTTFASSNQIRRYQSNKYDKKTEIEAEKRIAIFFSKSPQLRGCDSIHSGQDIIHLKNLFMSDFHGISMPLL